MLPDQPAGKRQYRPLAWSKPLPSRHPFQGENQGIVMRFPERPQILSITATNATLCSFANAHDSAGHHDCG